MKDKISIFVNTSDAFEDCWDPFFFLFNKYWPNCDLKIFLNTEKKEFKYNNLNIISTKVAIGSDKKLTWGECLIHGLKKIDTPIILYLQEDYFIDKPVKVENINIYTNILNQNKKIQSIRLYHRIKKAKYTETNFPGLLEINKNSSYLVSTQACLWKVKDILSYIKPEYSGWMFELLGTLECRKNKSSYLIFDPKIYKNNIIDYTHTGIIKGKWNKQIIKTFKENQIDINYNIRGFYEPKSNLKRRFETLQKIPLKHRYKLLVDFLGINKLINYLYPWDNR